MSTNSELPPSEGGTLFSVDTEERISQVLERGDWPPRPEEWLGRRLPELLGALREDAFEQLGEQRWAEVPAGERRVLLRYLRTPGRAEWLLLCVDVTARHLELRQAARNAYRLRSMLEGTRVGTWEWNVQTGETRFNERWAEIVGYRLEELEPVSIETWMRFAHEPDLERSNAALQAHFRGEAPFYDVECRMRHKEGHLVWVHDRGRVFTWTDEGEPLMMYGTHQDVTARKQEESARLRRDEQARDRERLASLGLMAGGIAHDFNNILQAIGGFAALLEEDLPHDLRAEREALARISRGVERAQGLTHQMLDYAGRGRISTERLSLETLTREVVELSRGGLPATIELSLQVAPGLPPLVAHAGQLHQVLMNLVRNAIESLPEGGGRVEVSLGERELGAAELAHERVAARGDQPLQPGRYLALEVRDEGSGISPEDLRRVFDPFFSTKFTGRGLGLASTYGILSGHGAGLTIETELGRGTRMQVLFPQSLWGSEAAPEAPSSAALVAEGAAAPRVAAPCPPPAQRQALVIDDEEAVREVVSRVLEREGWQARPFATGYPALVEFERAPQAWGLVVLDLTMPGMNGSEVLSYLRGTRADVPVVVMSGYSGASIQERFQEGARPNALLEKPFQARELRTLLGALFSA